MISSDELLGLAAVKAKENPFFLGCAFDHYKIRNKLSDEDLIQTLRCDRNTYNRLLLCRRPDANARTFKTDVIAIAETYEIDPFTLGAIIRETSVLDDMMDGVTRAATDLFEQRGLLAARDYVEDPDNN